MEDSDDINVLGLDPIDDAVVLKDQLSNILTVGFWNLAPDLGMLVSDSTALKIFSTNRRAWCGESCAMYVRSSLRSVLARADHSMAIAQQFGFDLLVRDRATGFDVGESFLDLLFYVQLIHDVIPRHLFRQLLDELFGGLFGGCHKCLVEMWQDPRTKSISSREYAGRYVL